RIGDAVLGLFQAELVEQALEAVAVLGEVDRVHRRAENGHARLRQSMRKFERRLAAKLHDDADKLAAGALEIENFKDVLASERLEIEAIRRVVIRRYGFGIAIDHDRFEAGLGQRETGVTAAIVEFYALPDAVRAAAENHDLVAGRWRRLALGRSDERRLIGRIHIGGGREELRRASVDALIDRAHTQRMARREHVALLAFGQRREA